MIFAVKLYDTEAAAIATRPLVGPATGVVTFQNGVDSVDVLARILGREHVVGGVAQIASVVAEPGVIRHTGTMARFAFGELDGRASARVEALAAALSAAAVDHAVSDAVQRDIWAKMVFLATFAGLTALMRLPIEPIRTDPETRALYEAGVAEALAIARGRGIALAQDFVAATLARTDQLPAAMQFLDARGSRARQASGAGLAVRGDRPHGQGARDADPGPRLHHHRPQAARQRPWLSRSIWSATARRSGTARAGSRVVWICR